MSQTRIKTDPRAHTLVHTHTVRPNEKEGALARQCRRAGAVAATAAAVALPKYSRLKPLPKLGTAVDTF